MSLGYAEKLSFKEDVGGSLGAPEVFDTATELAQSIEKLIQLVSEARSIIAFTGAGISTSTGIPDFRGPNGVWTAQKLGRALPKATVEFANAAPSLTHQALLALHGTGKLKYLVSQNVDGLHRRSGFPAAALAELHGNCFLERCSTCGATFTRDFEVETVGFMETGRFCEVQGCRGPLTDTVLDWDDALPAKELKEAEHRAKHADLAICLGTSLQIRPACNLPLRTVRVYKDRPQAGKLVIVNLQRTQHDKKALTSGGLVIHARTDDVMRGLMAGLHMQVPEYKRLDTFVLEVALIEQEAKRVRHSESGATGTPKDKLMIGVRNQHGRQCPLPFVEDVTLKAEISNDHVFQLRLEGHPFCHAIAAEEIAGRVLHVAIALHPQLGHSGRHLLIDHHIPKDYRMMDDQVSRYTFLTQAVQYPL
ncbi:SRTA1 [Auxenochlorella protothecoides x Auxenochlorella symbiontica]